MNASPDQIAAIRARISEASLGDDPDAIVAALNEPAIPNPEPQPTRPKPFTLEDLISKLDAAAIGKLRSLPTLDRLLDRIEANDRVNCRRWITLLVAGGDVTQAQAAGLAAVLDATEPDPAWKPLLSWSQLNLGRAVDGFDVMAALEE